MLCSINIFNVDNVFYFIHIIFIRWCCHCNNVSRNSIICSLFNIVTIFKYSKLLMIVVINKNTTCKFWCGNCDAICQIPSAAICCIRIFTHIISCGICIVSTKCDNHIIATGSDCNVRV